MFGKWTETDRLPHSIIKYRPRGKRSQGRPPKNISRLLMGPEQVTRP